METEVGEWLEKAKSDLNAAQYNFDGKQYEVAAFLCAYPAKKKVI